MSPACATVSPSKAIQLCHRIHDQFFEHPLLFVFIGLALAVRCVFWLYTGRVWEDALITLTPARNAWDGFGLTHHASEPRVHSFTSPVSVLIPLLGEGLGEGLLALRLAGLLAAIPTIYYAYWIGRVLKFHWAGQLIALSYLATDQLHIFFGMSGMETQLATAGLLANVYYLLVSRWWRLGFATGFGLMCRPEFVFWVPIVCLAVLLIDRRALMSVVLGSVVVAMPWYVFAAIYYGSPIPHTIIAKSISYRLGFMWQGWDGVRNYLPEWWKSFAPFREFWFTARAPLPDYLLKTVVVVVAALALLGLYGSLSRTWRMLAPAALIFAFAVYRTGMHLPTYFMWYLLPFAALFFLFVGAGISALAEYGRWPAVTLSTVLAVLYAIHIPFSFPLDRQMQKDVDSAVRGEVGRKLNELMKPEDTAVLEPLGYIGWAARNKTIYDMPGLGSRVSVEALKHRADLVVAGLIDALKPTYIVTRAGELNDLQTRYPETAAMYDLVAWIKAPPELTLSSFGYEYVKLDTDFKILRRRTP